MPQSPYGEQRIIKLWASNYRSLGEDVAIDLAPLTALVGPNGSGKSSVLDALRFVRDALTQGLSIAVEQRMGIDRLRRAAATRPRGMSVAVMVAGPDGLTGARSVYGFGLAAARGGEYQVSHEYVKQWDDSGNVHDVLDVSKGQLKSIPDGLAPTVTQEDLVLRSISAHPALRPLVDALRAMRIYSIYPRELAAPQAVGKVPPLDDQGSNWAAVLRSLSRERHRELVTALAKVLPDVVDLDVVTSGGYHTVQFGHRMPTGQIRRFNASQESDGTLRIASILTALLQDDPPPLIGIEEPELTINPGLLPLLLDFLREAARTSQIVITSHSPDLLDLVMADEVRVVQRHDGVTSVEQLSSGQQDVVHRALMGPGGLLRSGGLVGSTPERNLLDEADDDVVVLGRPG